MNLEKLVKKKKLEKFFPEKQDEMLDIPKVVFDDLELQIMIGQWLGILSSTQCIGTVNSGFKIYGGLSAKELMKRANITSNELKEITEKFGLLLKVVGIDSSETCHLKRLDKDKNLINCYLKKANSNAKIKLVFGDSFEYLPQFIIESGNTNKTYDYFQKYDDKPFKLNLVEYTEKSKQNEFKRYFSIYDGEFLLKSNNYVFSIKIDNPETSTIDYIRSDSFTLRNEKELQSYLLNLSFPIQMEEVYKTICQLSLESIDKYPKLIFKIEKLSGSTNEIVDLISLKKGELVKFITTTNGKKITIEGNEWSYENLNLSVSQDSDGNINYKLNSLSREQLMKVINPSIQVNEIEQEVNDVKKLTKSIIK